jgi:hypothetical protein
MYQLRDSQLLRKDSTQCNHVYNVSGTIRNITAQWLHAGWTTEIWFLTAAAVLALGSTQRPIQTVSASDREAGVWVCPRTPPSAEVWKLWSFTSKSLTSFCGVVTLQLNTSFSLVFVPSCCQDRVRGANAESSDEIARLNTISFPGKPLFVPSCSVSEVLYRQCRGNFTVIMFHLCRHVLLNSSSSWIMRKLLVRPPKKIEGQGP